MLLTLSYQFGIHSEYSLPVDVIQSPLWPLPQLSRSVCSHLMCGTSLARSPVLPPSIPQEGSWNTGPELPQRCQLLDQVLSTWESHENEAGLAGYQD